MRISEGGREMSSKLRRRKHSVELPTCYVLAIRRWGWSYSFGINPIVREPDPYMEFRHLTIHGPLIAPRNLKDQEAEITIIPDQDLDAAVRRQRIEKPLAIGSLGRNRGMSGLQGYLSLPRDALSTLLVMLVAERLKFVLLHGARIGRGGARLHSYRLSEAVTEDDLHEPKA